MYGHNHHFIKRQINTLFLFQVEVILFFNNHRSVLALFLGVRAYELCVCEFLNAHLSVCQDHATKGKIHYCEGETKQNYLELLLHVLDAS